MMKKQKNTFDLKTVYHRERPLSWSAISSFGWNKQQWYDKYVLGHKQKSTPELEFGSYVDKKLQLEPDFLPEVVRYPVMQHEMRAVYDGIPLIGIADAYHAGIPAIRDYKTGRHPWTQKRADETGQLTLYTFFLYKMEKIKPEDVELYIDWLPTHYHDKDIDFRDDPVEVHTFRTKRTMADILRFGQHIKETWKEMEHYAALQAGSVVHDRRDW